jgi:hypothetical protein
MMLLLAFSLAAISLMLFFVAAVVASVVVRLIRRGSAVAAEAYVRGESVNRWWQALHFPEMAGGARLDQRLALAGRRSASGTIMVEERASQPSYGR